MRHALILLLCWSALAWSTEYHVSPTGNDSAPGTAAQPLATPQRGVDLATQPGDTVLLHTGTYGGSVRLTTSGVPGQPITLRAAPGQHATLTGGIALRPSAPLPQGTIAWVTIHGLELTGSGGISMQNAFQVIITHNHIHHQPDQGISGNGYRVVIDGNHLEHCGPFDDPAAVNLYHGMYVGGTELVVTNNLWVDNLAYGVQLDGFPFDAALQPGPEYAGASRWLIAHNTFVHHTRAYGLVVWKDGARQNLITQNLFVGNGGGIQFQHSGPGNLVTRNLFWQGEAPDIADTAGHASYTVEGSVHGDPRFVGVGDYHLQPSSPALDAGRALALVPRDRDGITRPQGTAVDLGAYERVVAPPEPTPGPGALRCSGEVQAVPGPLTLVCVPEARR